jgi:anti-sigma factor RsiW
VEGNQALKTRMAEVGMTQAELAEAVKPISGAPVMAAPSAIERCGTG